MRIVIDTDEIKTFPKKVWNRMTLEQTFLFALFLVLAVPAIIDNYLIKKEGSCCVDVTLEPNDPPKKVVENTKFVGLFNTGKTVNLSKKEFDCLSRNIYWESLREPLIGQIAVATITHNRVKSKKWGDTFCKVVFEPKQFSWTNNKKTVNRTPKNIPQWERAKHSALLFTRGVRVPKLKDSEFYYAEYIDPPKWSKKMKKEAHIGRHIFFSNK